VKIGFQYRKFVPGFFFIRGHLPLVLKVQFSRSTIDNYRQDTRYMRIRLLLLCHILMPLSWCPMYGPTAQRLVKSQPLSFLRSPLRIKKNKKKTSIVFLKNVISIIMSDTKRDLCGQSAGCSPVPIRMATQVIRIGGRLRSSA